MLRRISCLTLFIGMVSMSVQAQQGQIDWNKALPVNSKVKVGKLDNGLTYYIRSNSEPKQRAEFFIVQNVGAILEEDNQNGLAHFLEHMAFNGTKNFPGKKLLTYFESVGVKFGQNINAYTSLDETVYNLSDVPTTREGIIDSALLVLHDWSGFISLEGTEIDNERGVIREEWRTGRGPEQRMNKEIMPIIYKDSKYAKRDVIGDIEVINNFDHKTLRDYYRKWYGPDLQAIIVVGDIDVNKIEQKIKTLFADVPSRENLTPRPYFDVPDNKEPLIGISSDPEARNTTIIVRYKRNPASAEVKNYGFQKDYIMKSLISSMISARFNEITQKPNPPFVFAGGFISSFTRTKDAYLLYAIAKNDDITGGLKSVIRESERFKFHGFTATELERSKADYLRSLENQFKDKDKQENSRLVNELVNNFLEGEPIPGIEFEFGFASTILPMITIDEINFFAKGLVKDDNLLVSIMGPKKDGVVMPSVDEVKKAIESVKLEKIEAYVDNVSNKPLVEKVEKTGLVTKVDQNSNLGTTQWTLSNGTVVVFKKTDFKEDEILLNAFSKGGLSLADNALLPSASFSTSLVSNGGVGEFSSIELEKMLAGKVVSLQPMLGESFEGFQGNTSPKDLETMLQLVYLYFTQPRQDEANFNTYLDRMKAYFANASADPRMNFRDSVSILMANRNPRVLPMNLDYLAKIKFQESLNFYKDRFADASDFTFIFTGNINPDEVKGLIEKYIGGLPSMNRNESSKDNGVRPPQGKVQNYFTKPLQTPKSSISISYTGNAEYNLENKVLIDVIKSVLNTRFIDEIREKEGATYGVATRVYLRNYPVPSFNANFTFDTDPKLRDKMIGIIHNEVKILTTSGPSEENLIKAKEFMLKSYEQNQRDNNYWSSTIREQLENGVDINTNYSQLVTGVTIEKVRNLAEKLFGQGNVVEVVMSPTE